MAILQIKDAALVEDSMRRGGTVEVGGDAKLEMRVREIIRRVRAQGDVAVMEFTKEFDGVDVTVKGIRVPETTMVDAYKKVQREEVDALERLKTRIERIEQRKLERLNYVTREEGLTIVHTARPVESVGCYVPGGAAAYPSTVLMTVVPAKVADVRRVVVCSPPTYAGEVHPLILVAASMCGVDEVYRAGGAHAIAALAYGTETIRPVSKIVGPGNRFVTLAKVMASKDVAIDLPAGPSEIVVIADETANPEFIALDLISQAEHTPDNVAGLVTTSRKLATEVVDEVERSLQGLERRAIVAESLSRNGFVVLCKTLEEAAALVNAFAPEHLEIMTRDPRAVAKRITAAGIILLGDYTPVSASDYCFGTNHVLPTSGSGHVYSELSVFDFVKRVNVVECPKEKLREFQDMAHVLALSEGLPNHFRAIEGRLRDDVEVA